MKMIEFLDKKAEKVIARDLLLETFYVAYRVITSEFYKTY